MPRADFDSRYAAGMRPGYIIAKDISCYSRKRETGGYMLALANQVVDVEIERWWHGRRMEWLFYELNFKAREDAVSR